MKQLSLKQAEQLIILMEEAAEIQQCCSKLLRFGIQDEYKSLDSLVKELGDILGIMEWITKEFDISPDLLIQYGKEKQTKMLQWSSYQDK